jgi:hypothetical protein
VADSGAGRPPQPVAPSTHTHTCPVTLSRCCPTHTTQTAAEHWAGCRPRRLAWWHTLSHVPPHDHHGGHPNRSTSNSPPSHQHQQAPTDTLHRPSRGAAHPQMHVRQPAQQTDGRPDRKRVPQQQDRTRHRESAGCSCSAQQCATHPPTWQQQDTSAHTVRMHPCSTAWRADRTPNPGHHTAAPHSQTCIP